LQIRAAFRIHSAICFEDDAMLRTAFSDPAPRLRRAAASRARAARVLALLLLAACARPAPPGEPTPAPAAETWRVVTYNIHHGEGLDRRVDLERIARVLRSLDADVIALQEVDSVVTRSGGEDQAKRLAELLGMEHAFGAFMDYQGGRYGMAILSRCAIRRANPVRLPDGNEPRVALAVELDAPGGPVTVVNVHFDWVAGDGYRFAQAQRVARFLDSLSTPYILAGDFNDRPHTRTLSLFRERAREAAKTGEQRFTFSADDPNREIDYVFVSGKDRWRVVAVDVVEETVASDHFPVVAELVLRRAAAGTGRRVAATPRAADPTAGPVRACAR
jgi:endonuclease/exonuclease/phosphatase family metal-dependent hydrolase